MIQAPECEQNFTTLLEMIDASEAQEDHEDFKNLVDKLFEELEEKAPENLAARQYKKYKLAAGKTAKSILFSCGVRLAARELCSLITRETRSGVIGLKERLSVRVANPDQ
jgi:type IV secretion system protein VirD4